MQRFGTFFLLIGLFLVACKKDTTIKPLDLGYDYFPLKFGSTLIYQIDSIDYNDFTLTVDTFSWKLKEFIDSAVNDASGRKVSKIVQYKSSTSENIWNVSNVYSAIRTNYTAERYEENMRYIKLVFPVKPSASWNINAFNTAESLKCSYADLFKPAKILNNTYDSTITVVHIDEETLISKDYSIEIYAKHIGLIYKKALHIERNMQGQIKKGTDFEQKLISFTHQ